MRKHIPNALTFLNLAMGVMAVMVIVASDHPYKAMIVPALIVAGGIIDFLDGFFARKMGAVSALGKNLDSFADIITFGIAPVAFISYLDPHPAPMFIVAIIYLLAAAYRLARFNLHAPADHFHGLPITAAGIILAIAIVILPTIPVLILTVLLALAMASKIQIKRIQ